MDGGDATAEESSTTWPTRIALIFVVTTVSGAFMAFLGVETVIWRVTVLASVVAGAILALPNKGRLLKNRGGKFYVGLGLAIFLPVLAAKLVHVASAETTLDRIARVMPDCRTRGASCEVIKELAVGTGVEEVTAYGVNRMEGDPKYNAGSAIVVLNRDGSLRWKSGFFAGYGLLALDTDATNHLYAHFAVTNHSGVAWAVEIEPNGVETFGTVAGGLPIDGYGVEQVNGARPLYAYREGWPAKSQNPTTSRDVFIWDGHDYVHDRCEIVRTGTVAEEAVVLEEIEAGSSRCLSPMGENSVNLDGSRLADQPPP